MVNQMPGLSVRWSVTLRDVPGCVRPSGHRNLAGGEGGRLPESAGEGPCSCPRTVVARSSGFSLNWNAFWQCIKFTALEKVIIT